MWFKIGFKVFRRERIWPFKKLVDDKKAYESLLESYVIKTSFTHFF